MFADENLMKLRRYLDARSSDGRYIDEVMALAHAANAAAVHRTVTMQGLTHGVRPQPNDATILENIECYMANAGDSELVFSHIRTMLKQHGRGKNL